MLSPPDGGILSSLRSTGGSVANADPVQIVGTRQGAREVRPPNPCLAAVAARRHPRAPAYARVERQIQTPFRAAAASALALLVAGANGPSAERIQDRSTLNRERIS